MGIGYITPEDRDKLIAMALSSDMVYCIQQMAQELGLEKTEETIRQVYVKVPILRAKYLEVFRQYIRREL